MIMLELVIIKEFFKKDIHKNGVMKYIKYIELMIVFTQ